MTDDLICRLSIRSLISSKINANDPSALSSRERTLANARVASLLTLRPLDLNERKIFRSMVDEWFVDGEKQNWEDLTHVFHWYYKKLEHRTHY